LMKISSKMAFENFKNFISFHETFKTKFSTHISIYYRQIGLDDRQMDGRHRIVKPMLINSKLERVQTSSAKTLIPELLVKINQGLNLPSLSIDYKHRVSEKKLQISFCQNFVKFPPILAIFGRKMAKRLNLCEMHSISISPNSRHHTTVLNADVPNCCTTLKVAIFNKLSIDLINTQ